MKKILNKVEEGELLLVLPENIKAEILFTLKNEFKGIQDKISEKIDRIQKDIEKEKGKTSGIIKSILEDVVEKTAEKIEKEYFYHK